MVSLKNQNLNKFIIKLKNGGELAWWIILAIYYIFNINFIVLPISTKDTPLKKYEKYIGTYTHIAVNFSLYKSEIPHSSESETLFVFTVITRSQNIGRPLLKRFPSCAIVCLCTITAATFTVSVRQTHWEYFLYEFSSISMCTLYISYRYTHTHAHTRAHTHTPIFTWNSIPTKPPAPFEIMTFSASCHSQDCMILSTFCTYTHLLTRERCFKNVYRPGKDTTRVVKIIKRAIQVPSLIFF